MRTRIRISPQQGMVLGFLVGSGGCGSDELQDALHVVGGVGKSLRSLRARGLAEWVDGNGGRGRWQATEAGKALRVLALEAA